jgi:hypothetical protein
VVGNDAFSTESPSNDLKDVSSKDISSSSKEDSSSGGLGVGVALGSGSNASVPEQRGDIRGTGRGKQQRVVSSARGDVNERPASKPSSFAQRALGQSNLRIIGTARVLLVSDVQGISSCNLL